MPETIEALVDGGSASAGPPLGPALGPMGIPIADVVKAINEKTAAFAGMKVPVKVIIEPKDKSFEITVGTPPTTALILKEMGIEKGSKDPRTEKVDNLKLDQIKKIADMKSSSILSKDTKTAVKEVLGTCVSMGITVEDQDPRDVQRAINQGKYDSQLS